MTRTRPPSACRCGRLRLVADPDVLRARLLRRHDEDDEARRWHLHGPASCTRSWSGRRSRTTWSTRRPSPHAEAAAEVLRSAGWTAHPRRLDPWASGTGTGTRPVAPSTGPGSRSSSPSPLGGRRGRAGRRLGQRLARAARRRRPHGHRRRGRRASRCPRRTSRRCPPTSTPHLRLHRAEILAALANAVVLLGVCGYLAVAGVRRLRRPRAGRDRADARRSRRSAWSPTPSRSSLLRAAQGRLAEHAGRLPRGARRPARLGAGRRRGGGDHGDRLPPRRPARVAGYRGADPAAVLVAAARRGRTCCSRPRRRTSTSTTYATTSRGCPASSTCTTCTRGPSPAACRCSPRTSRSPTRRWPSAASASLLDEFSELRRVALRRRPRDVPDRAGEPPRPRGPRRGPRLNDRGATYSAAASSGALLDRALGVQLGGHVGAADQVRACAPAATRSSYSAAHRLLARRRPRRGRPRARRGVAVDGDVQAGVVDPVVRHAADHASTPRLLEHRAVRPAGRLAEALADRGGLALQQVHLARRRPRLALGQPARVQRRGRRRPSAPSSRRGPRLASWVEEVG